MPPGDDLPPLVSIIQANITEFLARMDEVDAKIARLTDEVYSVKVGLLGDDKVKGQLDVLQARLAEFGSTHVTATADVDTSRGDSRIALLLKTLLAFGPAVAGSITVVSGSLAALPGIFSGLVTGAAAGGAALYGLGDALKAYSKAATDSGQSAAQAQKQINDLNAAMAKLSPSARQFVMTYENQLAPALRALARADQDLLFKGINEAVTELGPVFVAFVPYVLQAADGIGKFAVEFARLLGSAQGLRNLTTIWAEGNRFMEALGHATLTVVAGLMNLGAQGAPVIAQMGEAANNVADAFLRWTQDGRSEEFIRTVVRLAPQLGNALAGLWHLVTDLTAALTTLAGPSFTVIRFVAELLAQLIAVNPQLAAFLLTGVGIGSLLIKLGGVVTAIKATAVAFGLIGPAAVAAEGTVALASKGMIASLGGVGLALAGIGAAAVLVVQSIKTTVAAANTAQKQVIDTQKNVYAQAAAQDALKRGDTAAYKRASEFLGKSAKDDPAAYNGIGGFQGDRSLLPKPAVDPTFAKIQAQIEAMLKGGGGGGPLAAQNIAAQGAASTAATAAANAAKVAFNNLTNEVTGEHSKGLSQLNKLLQATHSGNLTTLTAALSGAHIGQLKNMVGQLNDSHKSELAKLSGHLTAGQRAQIEKELAANERVAKRITDAVRDAEAQKVMLTKVAQAAQTLAVQQAAATEKELSASANAAAKASIIAASQATLATAQAAAQAMSNASTAFLNAANAQATAITNQAQLAIDQAAATGLTGAALIAQQAKIAFDQTKISTDADIAAAQATYDAARSTTDAAISTAQAAYASAQAAAAVYLAAGAMTLATAQASGNELFIANARIAMAEQQMNAANVIATATENLNSVLGGSALSMADAARRLAEAQGNQAVALATANAAYNTAAAAAAAAAAAESAAGSAASAVVRPIVVQATIITQVDGHTLALTTTPLIRQEMLRTTARQTGNMFGGNAGVLGPTP